MIPSETELDPDVIATMTSLHCFKDSVKLTHELLGPRHNTEKVVYFLLLDRKLRNPCLDDDDDVKRKYQTRKRKYQTRKQKCQTRKCKYQTRKC